MTSMLAPFSLSVRRGWISYGVIALFTLLQLILVTQPFDFWLTNIFPDDAFYYFEIARNISEGKGFTFDGVEPTNGFHPLWLFILVVLFSFFSIGGTFDIAPIQATLFLLVLMNVATACILFSLVSRITQSQFVRALTLTLVLLNPFFLFETLNGLETSLALLLTSIFFLLAYMTTVSSSWRIYCILGIVGGCMVLARLDLAFYLAAFLGIVLLQARKDVRQRRWVIGAGVIAAAIILPWFLFNIVTFNMLLTSAANAQSMVNHELIVQDHDASLFQWAKAVVYNIDLQIREVFMRTGAPAVVIFLLGAAAVLIRSGSLTLPRTIKDITPTHALLLGFLTLFLVNVAIRFTGSTWYFISFGIFVALLFATVVTVGMPHIAKHTVLAAVLTCSVLFLFFVSWSKELRDRNVQQREMYAASVWANEHLPEHAVIGAFNSGIQGYFSDRRVINLDGLVNNTAYEAMRDKALWQYIQGAGVTHIIDFDIYLTYRYRSFFGISDPLQELTLVEKISLMQHTRSQDGISVYELVPH